MLCVCVCGYVCVCVCVCVGVTSHLTPTPPLLFRFTPLPPPLRLNAMRVAGFLKSRHLPRGCQLLGVDRMFLLVRLELLP